ncbi:hypothetical protein D3C77_620560 [compost metagenome]
MLTISRNEVSLGRSAKIHDQARAFGQAISTQHCKPAIQTKTLEVFITIAYATHLLRGLRDQHIKPEALGQQPR